METVDLIFFPSATEYPKLQKACPNDFPFTYEDFCKRVEQGIRSMPKGSTVKKIDVDIAEFLLWCKDTKIPHDNKARARYAAFVYSQSLNPITHA